MLVRQALPRATALSTTTRAAIAVRQQTRGYATPKGPPPANFRQSQRVQWHWDKDSTLDRMGKYFLLTEMARGMYVLLEQYFRPPYVLLPRIPRSVPAIEACGGLGVLISVAGTLSTILLRRYAGVLELE